MPRNRFSRFRDGVQISGIAGFVPQSGSVFYVSNNTVKPKLGIAGSDTNDGLTPERPFATLTHAIAACVANRGDTIILMPGHAENIAGAAGINVNIAGINIIGMGVDDARPKFTLITSAAASFDLNSASCSLQNIIILDNVGATSCLNVKNGLAPQIIGCYIRDGSSSFTTAITVNGGGANRVDKFVIQECEIYSAGATNGILLSEVEAQGKIFNNKILGSYSQSGIHNPTAKVLTNIRIDDNDITNTHASGYGIRMISAVTGEANRNAIYVATAGQELVTANLSCVGNRGTNALGIGDRIIPSPAPDGSTPQTLVSAIKALPQSTSATVFTVVGGPVLVTFFALEVTTAFGATVTTLQLTSTDTASSTGTTITGTTTVTSAAVGTFVTAAFTALSTAMQVNAGGTSLGVAGQTYGVIVPVGVVSITASASDTGNGIYHLRYTPLAPGAYVTMA